MHPARPGTLLHGVAYPETPIPGSHADRRDDLLHGHLAHVLQGVELYDGVPICYDCGDFVDDYRVDPDLRNDRSFPFELDVAVDGTLEELRLVPTEIRDCAVTRPRSGPRRGAEDACANCRKRSGPGSSATAHTSWSSPRLAPGRRAGG